MTSEQIYEPRFSRSDLAKILNVTSITIANREKRKLYPPPSRDINGWRTYSLQDILNLQLITFNMVDPRPILSLLYDKGLTDMKALGSMIDNALAARKTK